MPKKKSKRKLPWEYCECGCKGYSVSVGSRHFSVYWDLADNYYFCEGHHARIFHTKVFKSFEAADAHAVEIVKADKAELAKLRL